MPAPRQPFAAAQSRADTSFRPSSANNQPLPRDRQAESRPRDAPAQAAGSARRASRAEHCRSRGYLIDVADAKTARQVRANTLSNRPEANRPEAGGWRLDDPGRRAVP